MATYYDPVKRPNDRPHKRRIVGLDLPKAFDDLRSQDDPWADLVGCALIREAVNQ